MSRESEFRHKYGVVAAGAVSKSIIGRLPDKALELGPVAGVSFRVASRIANSLRAGFAVRSAEELNSAPIILFHSPPEHMSVLLSLLEAAEIEWAEKSLIVCDCEVERRTLSGFESKGASVSVARQFGLPRQIAIEGVGRSLQAATAIAQSLRLHVIEINPGCGDVFDAAVTLATTTCCALLDAAAELIRSAGIRDVESSQLAAQMFELATRAYLHSGRQSWAWYIRKPEIARIEKQVEAAGPGTGPMMRKLLLFALDIFDRHPEMAEQLRSGSI